MKADFTMHVNITDRQVVLTTDTNTMQGVDTALAINIMKTLEDTRGRLKKQIDKYYGDDAVKTGAQKEDGEGEGEGAQNKNDAPEAAAEAAEE